MVQDRPHLVAVEDAADTLQLYKAMLEEEYDVTGCQSCNEALDVLSRKHPDVILMDIGMPDMNGFECLRRIRANPAFAKVPVIAVTAFAYPADETKCRDAGFTEYLRKPIVDYAAFKQTIKDCLSRT